MGVYIPGMEMPTDCDECWLTYHGFGMVEHDPEWGTFYCKLAKGFCVDPRTHCPLIPVPPHGRLERRIVYRGEVYNALEAARINSLDGILTDPYKEGFHDGLKRAIQILANEVEDAPAIIPAEETNT